MTEDRAGEKDANSPRADGWSGGGIVREYQQEDERKNVNMQQKKAQNRENLGKRLF